ncbi:MAG: protein kinase [Bdellovibrionota bacterium]
MNCRGQIYYDQQKYSDAKKQFEAALEGVVTLNKEHLDTLFFLAKCDPEAAGQTLEMIENKMALNQIDPNALEKAKEIRKLIQEKSFSRLQSFSQFNHQSHIFSNPQFTGPRSQAHSNQFQVPQRYKTTAELGRGGMGVVYLAKDKVLDRDVALKILPAKNSGDKRTIDTFLREAKAAASLNHPNIVTVYDTGIQGGDYFIAMEHIDGYTIKKILKQKGKFALPVMKEIVKQLIKALAYAHQNNIVHRDLTTSNIMWTKQKMIKIMDFGLAKVVKELQSEQSIIGGTPSFMSPEQTLGKPVDHRTDIYSLGICMFEMSLGTLPFTKGDLGYHHLHTDPPVPMEVDPNIPKSLSDAILKCMQKKPEDRYQSVEDLIDVLKEL